MGTVSESGLMKTCKHGTLAWHGHFQLKEAKESSSPLLCL